MDWQQAASESPIHYAERVSKHGGEVVLWRRRYDGEAYYIFQGRIMRARTSQVEGFDDWYPVRDKK